MKPYWKEDYCDDEEMSKYEHEFKNKHGIIYKQFKTKKGMKSFITRESSKLNSLGISWSKLWVDDEGFYEVYVFEEDSNDKADIIDDDLIRLIFEDGLPSEHVFFVEDSSYLESILKENPMFEEKLLSNRNQLIVITIS